MGRIADALRKAEQQRQQRLQDQGAVAVAEAPQHGIETESAPSPPDHTQSVPDADAEKPRRVQGMSECLVPYYDPSSVISEQYRGLRTRFLSQNPDNEHRVIAVTSSAPREGKSVSTLNTAFILAEIRHLKVVVVDCDFRRGSLAQMLSLPDSPGLADVLQGHATYEEALQQTAVPNLYFMPAGHTGRRSAAEILSDPTTGAMLERFRKEFHYTLVDTPPATTVTDVGIIGQWCSGVVMVVRLNRIPEPVAQRAVRVLQVNNVPILGVLLIGDEGRAPGYGSYRYYNYYYRYYQKRNGARRR